MRKGMQGPLARSQNTPPPEFAYNPPTDNGLEILHHDDDLLVLSKPSGLLSVSGKAENHKDSLETRAQKEFPDARIVHRLDRGTSGVFVMALNANAHRHLGLQFEKRQTSKTYIALVSGLVAKDEGTIDLALRTDWYNRPKQMVDKLLGREAITHWSVLAREAGVTLMELKPETGRSHQLRVHMMELGHPIVGDTFYASSDIASKSDRLMLHAEQLELHHPANGERIAFVASCPFD